MVNSPSKRQPSPWLRGIFMELSMWPTSWRPISSWMSKPTTETKTQQTWKPITNTGKQTHTNTHKNTRATESFYSPAAENLNRSTLDICRQLATAANQPHRTRKNNSYKINLLTTTKWYFCWMVFLMQQPPSLFLVEKETKTTNHDVALMHALAANWSK